MTRQPTPTNLLDTLLPTTPNFPPAPLPALRYDYAALGAAGEGIRKHVLSFKAAENRMAENTVQAGLDLIAIRETIPHNHWLPLLSDELGIGERAAQVMMQTARRFGSKAQTYALLTPSVLALLSSPSVPDEAVEVVIAAETSSGKVSVAQAKAIIAQHKAAGKCRKCGRTLTDPAAAANGIGACCAARLARAGGNGYTEPDAVEDKPLPDWAQEDATIPVAPDFAPVHLPEINITMSPDAPAPAVIAQRVIDVLEAEGILPWTPYTANATPAPQPAPPRNDSVVVGVDGRTEALGRLAQRLEGWLDELREVAQEYGNLTGDFTTPLEIKHRLERMQVRVQANGENGGWE